MQIVSREGSLVTLRDKKGKLWLTRRYKARHDNRRRRNTRVFHFPIKRIIEKGDWIFTCSLKPLRFGEWDKEKDPKHYNRAAFIDTEWEEFAKWDDFTTLEGSHHSKAHCSLTPISDEYAEFFNKHELWQLFEVNNKDFDLYEAAVKKVCEAFKIKFEGI